MNLANEHRLWEMGLFPPSWTQSKENVVWEVQLQTLPLEFNFELGHLGFQHLTVKTRVREQSWKQHTHREPLICIYHSYLIAYLLCVIQLLITGENSMWHEKPLILCHKQPFVPSPENRTALQAYTCPPWASHLKTSMLSRNKTWAGNLAKKTPSSGGGCSPSQPSSPQSKHRAVQNSVLWASGSAWGRQTQETHEVVLDPI